VSIFLREAIDERAFATLTPAFHSINSVVAFQLALAIVKGILYYPLAFLTGLRAPPNVIDGLDSIAVFADDDE